MVPELVKLVEAHAGPIGVLIIALVTMDTRLAVARLHNTILREQHRDFASRESFEQLESRFNQHIELHGPHEKTRRQHA